MTAPGGKFSEQPTALYRWYDVRGRLLYVGISFNPVARATQHAVDQTWWHHVASCTVEWFNSRLAEGTAAATAGRSVTACPYPVGTLRTCSSEATSRRACPILDPHSPEAQPTYVVATARGRRA